MSKYICRNCEELLIKRRFPVEKLEFGPLFHELCAYCGEFAEVHVRGVPDEITDVYEYKDIGTR